MTWLDELSSGEAVNPASAGVPAVLFSDRVLHEDGSDRCNQGRPRPVASSLFWSPSPAELHRAIGAGELEVYLQPIVDASSRQLVKAEALARWHHPERGPVAPDLFVPVAEGTPELSDTLTFWAIEQAAQCQRALMVPGLDVQIAVNVSAVNLRDLRFPDLVLEVIERAGVKASRIVLELTETATFQDPGRTTDVLRRLRSMGFGLALDDFGTGYSTLKVLKQMPFSALKVDRCFIADLLGSRDSAAIVQATIDMARHMDLQTVAEGIETEEIAAALHAMGIDALQGYHIGYPMPAERLIAQFAEPQC